MRRWLSCIKRAASTGVSIGPCAAQVWHSVRRVWPAGQMIKTRSVAATIEILRWIAIRPSPNTGGHFYFARPVAAHARTRLKWEVSHLAHGIFSQPSDIKHQSDCPPRPALYGENCLIVLIVG